MSLSSLRMGGAAREGPPTWRPKKCQWPANGGVRTDRGDAARRMCQAGIDNWEMRVQINVLGSIEVHQDSRMIRPAGLVSGNAARCLGA